MFCSFVSWISEDSLPIEVVRHVVSDIPDGRLQVPKPICPIHVDPVDRALAELVTRLASEGYRRGEDYDLYGFSMY